MTTIVYDGEAVYTDSQVNNQGMRFGVGEKAKRLSDGSILAVAGEAWIIEALSDYIEGGEMPKLSDDDGFTAILVKPDGRALEYCKTGVNEIGKHDACIPWAGGSGEDYAMTALHLGKTGKEAVEVACELDTRSGGPVMEYRCG